jgi:signal peptidase I
MSEPKSAIAPANAQGRVAARDSLWDQIRTVIYALLIALAVRTLIFQPYTIPSASEEPNLYQGDYIVVSKWSYGYSRHSILGSPPLFSGRLFGHAPARGDVVVFKLPRDGRTDYIKRLVGLPGDRIQVRQGQLFINGKALGESAPRPVTVTDRGWPEQGKWVRETNPEGRSYMTQVHGSGTEAADNTGVYVVPSHCYFMMGDNRQNSEDSRFDPGLLPSDPRLGGCGWNPAVDGYLPAEEGVGFVPEENLVGRARFVLLSWKEDASFFKPWTWLDLRMNRFLRPVH